MDMKKLLFTFITALVVSLTLFASEVSPALESLLSRFGIEANQPLEGIVDDTQRLWLRKPGQERWDLPDFPPGDRVGLVRDLCNYGFIEEVRPAQTSYTYSIILGATIPSMQKRIEYLGTLWNRGVRFERLVFLASNRELCLKGDRTLPNESFKNEMEALLYLFKNSSLPKELKELPLDVVLAKRDVGRPNTADTVRAWLEKSPSPGCALAISSQPHVQYQAAVLRGLLPKAIPIETVGPEASQELNIGVALDACARTLYAELEIERKSRYTYPYEKSRNRPGSTQEHPPQRQASAAH